MISINVFLGSYESFFLVTFKMRMYYENGEKVDLDILLESRDTFYVVECYFQMLKTGAWSICYCKLQIPILGVKVSGYDIFLE